MTARNMLKKHISIVVIITVIIIITLISVCLPISGINTQKENKSVENPSASGSLASSKINSSFKEFPNEIQGEIQTLSDKYSIAPHFWGFDPVNNEIGVIAYGIHDMNITENLQGKKIGNFTILVFNNTDFQSSAPTVVEYIEHLKKNPNYQIESFEVVHDAKGPYIILWCESATSENIKLENLVFRGWRIHVYVCCGIPSTNANP